ncbi:MAG: hypothetical protein ACOVS5_11325, partial [Oligoflexus sp.]
MESSQKRLKKARELFKANKHAEALPLLIETYSLFPVKTELKAVQHVDDIATCLAELYRYDDAISMLKELKSLIERVDGRECETFAFVSVRLGRIYNT